MDFTGRRVVKTPQSQEAQVQERLPTKSYYNTKWRNVAEEFFII